MWSKSKTLGHSRILENYIYLISNVCKDLNKELGDKGDSRTGYLKPLQGSETKGYFSLSPLKEVTLSQKLLRTHGNLLRRDGGEAEHPTTPTEFRIAGVWFGYS